MVNIVKVTFSRPQGRTRLFRRILSLMAIVMLGLAGALVVGLPRAFGQMPGDGMVCAQVVIAIDGSRSTAASAFARQLGALGHAFRDPRLARAVQDCLPGSVGVAATP